MESDALAQSTRRADGSESLVKRLDEHDVDLLIDGSLAVEHATLEDDDLVIRLGVTTCTLRERQSAELFEMVEVLLAHLGVDGDFIEGTVVAIRSERGTNSLSRGPRIFLDAAKGD